MARTINYQPVPNAPTVQVPAYSTSLHLAMTPQEARLLRARLSKAINAGGPVLLSVSNSAGGPTHRVLHVNDTDAYSVPAGRSTHAVLGRRGAVLTLAEPDWRDATDDPQGNYLTVLIDGEEASYEFERPQEASS